MKVKDDLYDDEVEEKEDEDEPGFKLKDDK